ncbi:hypothetical protein MtrunA17_Chr2g0286861 [Medicago truncatula]|uniref:Transmembrane protein n=1 Tax=Medicago truncatula TaxID=3880 RepID=I3S1I5_MEDTR|nr:unknown [Medicago truncatula]RHN72364.1 hypothetical protein MtrunA17_Chr2g0286861 [Medicago truncatula]
MSSLRRRNTFSLLRSSHRFPVTPPGVCGTIIMTAIIIIMAISVRLSAVKTRRRCSDPLNETILW